MKCKNLIYYRFKKCFSYFRKLCNKEKYESLSSWRISDGSSIYFISKEIETIRLK